MKDKKNTRIAMAGDTGAFAMKEAVKDHLTARGYEIWDLGPARPGQEMTYVEAGRKGGNALSERKANFAVLFCGSGAGVMTVANKYKGVYAVVCESPETAKSARIINNANVLCMGANVLQEETAKEMAECFLQTGFAQGFDRKKTERLRGFLGQIAEIEGHNFK